MFICDYVFLIFNKVSKIFSKYKRNLQSNKILNLQDRHLIEQTFSEYQEKIKNGFVTMTKNCNIIDNI